MESNGKERREGKFIVKCYPDARALQTQLNQWVSQGYSVEIKAAQVIPREDGGGVFVIIWREKGGEEQT